MVCTRVKILFLFLVFFWEEKLRYGALTALCCHVVFKKPFYLIVLVVYQICQCQIRLWCQRLTVSHLACKWLVIIYKTSNNICKVLRVFPTSADTAPAWGILSDRKQQKRDRGIKLYIQRASTLTWTCMQKCCEHAENIRWPDTSQLYQIITVSHWFLILRGMSRKGIWMLWKVSCWKADEKPVAGIPGRAEKIGCDRIMLSAFLASLPLLGFY